MHAIKIVLASCIVLTVSTGLALAHAGMRASNIAADAVIDTLPAAFTMSFTQPGAKKIALTAAVPTKNLIRLISRGGRLG